MYEVETVEGLRWNRHTDQMRSNSAVDDRDSTTRDGQSTVSAQAALADYAIAVMVIALWMLMLAGLILLRHPFRINVTDGVLAVIK
ncbi:jg16359 [Pararge aegeria aegeria]|uniref:Jg16359 protein n=1 Tax=Pararge aegeria aegeria TaxID=348720 RepID=A0A8S4RU15_9NEOP|nr:jg16359 [Pararge aegeria aegeria]